MTATFTGDVNNIVLPSPKNLPTIGGLYVGPLTATVPDAAFTIDSAMKLMGFVGQDGVDEKEDRSTKKIFAWGSDIVASPQESYSLSATFTLYEFLNADVAKTVYGAANVTATAATTTAGSRLSIMQTADQLADHTWLLDTYSPGGKRVQKFFPIGHITSKDTQKWSNTEVLAHRVTVDFYPDNTGRFSYTRTDNGILSA